MPRPVAPRPLRGLAAGFGCTFDGMVNAPSAGHAPSPPGPVPVAPSEEAWRALGEVGPGQARAVKASAADLEAEPGEPIAQGRQGARGRAVGGDGGGAHEFDGR